MVPPAQVMEVFAEPDCKMVAKHLCDYSGHGLLDLAAYDDYLQGRLDLGRTGLSAASTAGRPSEPSPDRAD
jgi:hypothetical protein